MTDDHQRIARAVYEAACTTLQTPDDFRRLTLAVLQETAAHGVVYLETFVSPDFCGGGDLVAWKDYLAAMSDAAAEGEARFGITMRGIVTGIRHFGPDACKPAARCAAETFGGFVVGYGLAGGEMAGRPADYAYSFDIAREAGLPLTCHAGEWGGAAMVAETIRDLKVARIGDNMRHVAVTEGDKVSAQIRFGWEVNTFGVGDLVAKINATTKGRIDKLCALYEEKYRVAPELRKGGKRHAKLDGHVGPQ